MDGVKFFIKRNTEFPEYKWSIFINYKNEELELLRGPTYQECKVIMEIMRISGDDLIDDLFESAKELKDKDKLILALNARGRERGI